MRIAETVTFGGAGLRHHDQGPAGEGSFVAGKTWLDRAGHLRGQPEQIAAAWTDPAARVMVLWRGKPLIAGAARNALGWLDPWHPALQALAMPPVFLGLGPAGPRFAADISGWEPSGTDAAALAGFFDPSEQHHPLMEADHRFAELRGVMVALAPDEAEMAAMARALYGWHASHGFCAKCGAASLPSFAGWQRTCPACGAHHFPRTDPVVIMLITEGNSVLIGRSPGWPEGMYSLLAGFIEPGETMEAAVRREVFEEAGVRVGRVGFLASQPWPFPASLMLGCHGAALGRDIVRDPAEIEDALWLTREEMADVMAGRHPVIKPARRGAIAHFLIANWLADRLD